MKWKNKNVGRLVAVGFALVALTGCSLRMGMYDQGKVKPLAQSEFYADGRASRPPVEGTVPRGLLKADDHFYRGMVGGKPATSFPFNVTKADIKRGQERFNIYCSVCHGRTGRGDGMVVRRGYKRPTSFHDDRLVASAPGYFFQVMTQGFGVMPSYAAQVEPRDRWNIAAYLQALQYSQRAKIDDVPQDERENLR